MNPLQITDIKADSSGVQISLQGRDKAVKISSNLVLIRDKVINTEDLKIGDEILAYGLDKKSNVKYNNSVKKTINRRNKNGKRNA